MSIVSTHIPHEKIMRTYECDQCWFPARARATAFGIDRPRCPWCECDNYGLMMQVING